MITKSDDPTWLKVGTRFNRIWTFTPTCEPGSTACEGSVTSSSGAEFTSTWNGVALQESVPEPVTTWVGDCVDDTGAKVGPVTVRQTTTDPVVYSPSAPVDEDTGLPAELTGSYVVSETIIKYDAVRGPSRPRDCPFEGNNKIRHTATYDVTITLGAAPDVVKAEEERVRQEKQQAEKKETP